LFLARIRDIVAAKRVLPVPPFPVIAIFTRNSSSVIFSVDRSWCVLRYHTNVMNVFSFWSSPSLKGISWMSLIDLEEVSGTVIIHNRTFSAKDVLRAVIREAVPVEFREGTLAIGIERVYPLGITNSRDHPSPQREECPLLIQEIAQVKHAIRQLQLGNRELEQNGTTEERELSQFLKIKSNGSRKEYRNRDRVRYPVPPTPFPEQDNGDPFDLFREPGEGVSGNGFLRTQTKCKKCGQILPETAKFCNVCGSPTIELSTGQKTPGGRENSIPKRDSSRRLF